MAHYFYSLRCAPLMGNSYDSGEWLEASRLNDPQNKSVSWFGCVHHKSVRYMIVFISISRDAPILPNAGNNATPEK
ncbi:MAG: hypothetical protein Fur0021_22620 [Candidatus Promineifilaceae bacterium]